MHFSSRSEDRLSSLGDTVRTARRGLVAVWNHPPRWLEVINGVAAEASQDRIPTVAAGITFFGMLALFPGIAAIVSLYGMFADRSSIAHVLDVLAPYLPGGVITVLNNDLHRLIVQKSEKLNVAFVGGLAIATWSASGGLKALLDGLNVAYETQEQGSFLKFTFVAFVVTLAGLVFGALALICAVIMPALAKHSYVLREIAVPLGLFGFPIALVLCALLIETIYRLGPDRTTRRSRFISPGSVVASVLWITATLLFSWYVQNFGSYDRVYGNLGAAVGFMTWMWILTLILLVCAELNCEIERKRIRH